MMKLACLCDISEKLNLPRVKKENCSYTTKRLLLLKQSKKMTKDKIGLNTRLLKNNRQIVQDDRRPFVRLLVIN